MDLKNIVPVLASLLMVGVLAVFGVLIWKMAVNKIELARLVSEPDNKASLSRFQLLIFTLAVAGLYVILSIENGQLLEVPNSTLTLLGISSGSFLVSKGIGLQGKQGPDQKDDTKP